MSASRTSTMSDLLNPKSKIAVVLLAAGEGIRMGSIPKALLRRGERTLLESFCIELSSLEPKEILVPVELIWIFIQSL
ncbi:NTP transferase domain-containing protein [Polynucleobacter necessarius]|uniref:NTP transferase domain-containing protein n=1 Tax=Polynucleobacter necessarius TaxID=576610 RepID=UPI001E32F506|nr:NTP transferase domain-containing protein [Polynucleobacter necessarius]